MIIQKLPYLQDGYPQAVVEDLNNHKILLPDDPNFNKWLSLPPPGWQDMAAKNDNHPYFAITPDSSVPVIISDEKLNELCFDAGLYWDDSINEEELIDEESICYYPSYVADGYS